VVAVADTGPGIPPDQMSRIFERFYQVDRSRSRPQGHTEGAGLGLAICQELAQAHQGRITAESVVGIGSKFSVILPADDAASTITHRKS
jgi:signal transduction histidine kinase